jgi:hypothetical protein
MKRIKEKYVGPQTRSKLDSSCSKVAYIEKFNPTLVYKNITSKQVGHSNIDNKG